MTQTYSEHRVFLFWRMSCRTRPPASCSGLPFSLAISQIITLIRMSTMQDQPSRCTINWRKPRQIACAFPATIAFVGQQALRLCDPAYRLPQSRQGWRGMWRLADRAGERLPFVVHQDLHTCHLFI